MKGRVKEYFRKAAADKAFVKLMRDGEGEGVPGWFADDFEKHLFVGCYLGYLLGKYGKGYKSIIGKAPADE